MSIAVFQHDPECPAEIHDRARQLNERCDQVAAMYAEADAESEAAAALSTAELAAGESPRRSLAATVAAIEVELALRSDLSAFSHDVSQAHGTLRAATYAQIEDLRENLREGLDSLGWVEPGGRNASKIREFINRHPKIDALRHRAEHVLARGTRARVSAYQSEQREAIKALELRLAAIRRQLLGQANPEPAPIVAGYEFNKPLFAGLNRVPYGPTVNLPKVMG